MLFSEIFFCTQEFFHAFLIFLIHYMGDAVSHVQRTCGIPGENFGMNAALHMIEENIVARAGKGEILKDEPRQSLDRIGKAVRASVLLQRYIEFAHAADGVRGNRSITVTVLMDDFTHKIFFAHIVPVVIILQTDDLGMGMTLGTARVRPVIAEENDRLEPRISFPFQPVRQTEGDNPVQLLLPVGSEAGMMVRRFHDDRRAGLFKNGEFIHQPDDIPFGFQNIGQVFRMAERTYLLLSGVRLLRAYRDVVGNGFIHFLISS